MAQEPRQKRAIVFFDGQNLFHSAKSAFGFTYPNYDPAALAGHVCRTQNWMLAETRFYTGVPSQQANPKWHRFWQKKLRWMGSVGIKVYSRPLRYRNKVITLPDGTQHTVPTAEEKGIDVRIAVDVISCTLNSHCDVAVIFSQDQDLSEVADEIRVIAKAQDRWIKIASAFPVSPTVANGRGIDRTDWIRIDRTAYTACLDPHNKP